MRISDPQARLVANEGVILDELLHLEGATILELGCGKAEKTRIVADKAASVLALEVDETQLAKNLAVTDLPKVRFAHGGAEKIPAPDSNFDIVLMFKSLHHVPGELTGQYVLRDTTGTETGWRLPISRNRFMRATSMKS